jgi:hypothetical protein
MSKRFLRVNLFFNGDGLPTTLFGRAAADGIFMLLVSAILKLVAASNKKGAMAETTTP